MDAVLSRRRTDRTVAADTTNAFTVGAVKGDWRTELPTLQGSVVALRELRVSDAASLLSAMRSQEVSRFISPPPPPGFARRWPAGNTPGSFPRRRRPLPALNGSSTGRTGSGAPETPSGAR